MVVQLLLHVFLCRQNRPGMADSLTYTSSEQVQVVTTASQAQQLARLADGRHVCVKHVVPTSCRSVTAC